MGLKEYQAKRNFRRTPEPPGKVRLHGRTTALRFVIQKLAASHLHYDFRLEMEAGILEMASRIVGYLAPRSLFPGVRGALLSAGQTRLRY
jgi:bifunctional non-homologous end joining protein LigD